MKQARLDQLADSIFAIVMTILVFEIRIPDYVGVVSDRVLLDSIMAVYPAVLSYVLGFLLLFTYWRSHHFIQSILAKNIDAHFSNLNAFFFLFVGLVPFSSYILANYSYSKVATIIFGLNIILIGMTLFFMRRYVIKAATIENEHFSDKENMRANLHILFPVGSSLLAIVISFFSINIALVLFALAILFNLFRNSARYSTELVEKLKGENHSS